MLCHFQNCLYIFPITDNFTLFYLNDLDNAVPFSGQGISWKSDRETKFQNPSGGISEFDNFAKPKDWIKPISALDNQMKNEDFIVWMRVAAFPTFRKLYRKLDRNSAINTNFREGLKLGEYTLKIGYSESHLFICICLLRKMNTKTRSI